MTQRKRRVVASICACGSVVASFGFWTAVVSRSVLVEQERNFRQDRSLPAVWDGVVRTVGSALGGVADTLAEVATEQMHLAASAVQESAVPSEVLGGLVPSGDVIASDAGTSEFSQWNISFAYSLSIPHLDIRTPVLKPSMQYWTSREWDLLEKQMQVALNSGAVAYPHSVTPGERGSIIIAGHSSPPNLRAAQSAYGNVFARIPELRAGESIFLFVAGEKLEYKVRDSEVVSSAATEILRQQDRENILKIITCYPVGTTKDRIVVTAVLVE